MSQGQLSPRLPLLLSRLGAVTALVALVALLPWLSGTAPEYTVLRARYTDLPPTPEVLGQIRSQLGLDAGPLRIFGRWLLQALRGDFGVSWVSGEPVLPGVLAAAEVSLTLMGFSLAVVVGTALLLVWPVLHTGARGRVRRGPVLLCAALAAIPEFLLGTALLVVVAVLLRWLPPYGWAGPRNAVLPALALGLPSGGVMGGLLADALAGAFSERWVQTWQLARASRWRIAVAGLRRALPQLTSQLALLVVGVTGGSMAVETVFAIPGLGRLMIQSASAQDIPLLQCAIVLLLSLAVGCGALAGLARRLLLGAAVRTGALPVQLPGPRTRRRDRVVPVAAAVLLGITVLLGLLRDPRASGNPRLAAPSWALPLGADASGRDLLGRLGHGALVTLGLALAVTVACLLLGLLIGLLGDWGTGLVEVANAAPSLVVGVAVAAVSGASAWGAALAVALVGWAPIAAHAQSLVAEARARPHIRVRPTWGVGRARLLIIGVLPDVLPALVRNGLLRLPSIALSLASLGFLGLGAQPPIPEWGLLLAEGVGYVERAPWTVLAPTVGLTLAAVTAVGFSVLERAPENVLAAFGTDVGAKCGQ